MSIHEKIGWEDIVLKAGIKEILLYNTSGLLSKKDLFDRKGIPLKRGLLFYGPPGNGKTMVGKILAKEVDANFVWVTPKDLIDAGPRDIADIYSFARLLAPAIIFFEDIDLIGGEDRFGRSFQWVLGELLSQLDGFDSNHGVITIATTNNIEVLDKALANRPGRFDIRIEFPNPDYQLRLAVLKQYIQNHPVASGLNLAWLAEGSDGLSCAHIKEIVTRALILGGEKDCFDEEGEILITQENLEQALSAMGGKKIQVGFCLGNLEKEEDG
jgi:cell division protease FtsH